MRRDRQSSNSFVADCMGSQSAPQVNPTNYSRDWNFLDKGGN
jgi:hypothetical protein